MKSHIYVFPNANSVFTELESIRHAFTPLELGLCIINHVLDQSGYEQLQGHKKTEGKSQ